jgi:KDO2-lipid IV(A) lauroyltransferase
MMRERFEFAPVWLAVKATGLLPRPVARALGISVARAVYWLHSRLRAVGMRNLALAFPDMPLAERRRILKNEFTSLGRQLAEVCLFPRYNRDNIDQVVVYDGFENFQQAFDRGRGVLFLTAHLGGWELSAFAHSLHGHPLHIVMRPLDNPFVDRLVHDYRTMHGNTTVAKDDFVRGLLGAMKTGGTVGILMDTNMTPPQGVFVPFFDIPACTASGLARIALRTDAAVVPGFTIWDEKLKKYRLRFDPAVDLIRTGDDNADIVANTARFTAIIEHYVRRYPGQWLWVHRRWKTRPPGEPPLY